MPDLDGIRGILALCVVLLHFGVNSFLKRTFGYDGFAFELCVDVFFILSGFVLTASFVARRPTLTRFAIARYFRLAPVALVTMAAVVAVRKPDYPLVLLSAELAMAVPLFGYDPANFPAWSIAWEFFIQLS
jgi:peptidoglycan/LPS O-acetylase OafA/YrhL